MVTRSGPCQQWEFSIQKFIDDLEPQEDFCQIHSTFLKPSGSCQPERLPKRPNNIRLHCTEDQMPKPLLTFCRLAIVLPFLIIGLFCRERLILRGVWLSVVLFIVFVYVLLAITLRSAVINTCVGVLGQDWTSNTTILGLIYSIYYVLIVILKPMLQKYRILEYVSDVAELQ